jgi:hypothetical protein
MYYDPSGYMKIDCVKNIIKDSGIETSGIGTRAKRVGENVFHQNDNLFHIDFNSPNLDFNPKGLTNLELMKRGNAPIGHDGQKIVLHHVKQTPNGPIIEMPEGLHRKNNKKLHKNTGQSKSKIDREKFDRFRIRYWKQRKIDFKNPK